MVGLALLAALILWDYWSKGEIYYKILPNTVNGPIVEVTKVMYWIQNKSCGFVGVSKSIPL